MRKPNCPGRSNTIRTVYNTLETYPDDLDLPDRSLHVAKFYHKNWEQFGIETLSSLCGVGAGYRNTVLYFRKWKLCGR